MGAGGHAKVVAEAALVRFPALELAFLDIRYPELSTVLGYPVVGCDSDAATFSSYYAHVVVALGDNRLRMARIAALADAGFELPILVHPTAWVSPSASIGSGTVIFGGAVVNAEVHLGTGCIVNTGATIDHDCNLGDAVHISPGAHIGGGTTIGARTWVGIGAAVSHCIRIGSDVMIGAGAAVVSDLPSSVKAVGVPARVIQGDS
jgi:sugar O-acyltransferase (sialic acid O-acetyltransferase NeuD family)